MTKISVLDKNSGMQNILSAKGTKPVSPVSNNFDSVLKQTSGSDQKMAAPEKNVDADKTKESVDETKGNALRDKLNGKEKTEETKTAKTEEPTDTEDMADDTDVLEKAGGEMVAAIAAQFNIPTETVTEAMDDLGMTEVSLLQPENVKELMVELTDGADNMSMLTDGEFYDSVMQALETLDSIVEDAGEKLQMDPEQVKAFAKETEDQIILTKAPEIAEEAVEAVKEEPETKQEEVAKLPAKRPELTETARTEITTPKEAPRQEHGSKDSDHSFMQDGYQNPTVENQAQTQSAEEAGAQLPVADTQEIMDQIMDYMKVSVKPELSDLEMQLHPESLGNLHIHISSREGVVTAQFTAQNESVRAVLESQMMELKQNLEAQGVKVEAVEVTIAQYSLERNPEGDGEAAGQGQKQKKGVRNLNLGELNLEEEELTEEEKLTAEMMKSEGSTISYTA